MTPQQLMARCFAVWILVIAFFALPGMIPNKFVWLLQVLIKGALLGAFLIGYVEYKHQKRIEERRRQRSPNE